MKENIKIGLDFHGVITDNPVYFREFCRQAQTLGWEIHIITGGPRAKVAAMLKEWKISYTKLFAIFDFYKRRGLAEIYEDGDFKIEKRLWDTAKSRYCRKHHISLQIDDSRVYERAFQTPYCYYDAGQKFCTTKNGFHLDLTQPPAEALKIIAARWAQM